MVWRTNAPLPLFQPDQGWQNRFVDISPTSQERRRDNVEIAVAVEVSGQGAVDAGHLRQRVLHERVTAGVLSDWIPGYGFDDPVVPGIAVSQQHVEVAVLVDIDKLDAG